MPAATQHITIVSAADYSLVALAEIFTRSFEAYFYPGTTSAQQLSRRVRLEQIDLAHSLVLVADDAPAGIALIALRDRRAWCAGFGIYAAARGRGLAHTLAAAMVERARSAEAREISLEVLTRNAPAIQVYQRAGLSIWRDLQILEWRRPDPWAGGEPIMVRDEAPGALLDHFARLHLVAAAWQRDLPALLATEGLRGITVGPVAAPDGYLLYQGQDGGRIRIADLAVRDLQAAQALLRALQSRAESIISVNEPADSPLISALTACGFSEIDRQHELRLQLEPSAR
jgi:ribosomal protein S18 acetylase RimI-like enzyme